MDIAQGFHLFRPSLCPAPAEPVEANLRAVVLRHQGGVRTTRPRRRGTAPPTPVGKIQRPKIRHRAFQLFAGLAGRVVHRPADDRRRPARPR